MRQVRFRKRDASFHPDEVHAADLFQRSAHAVAEFAVREHMRSVLRAHFVDQSIDKLRPTILGERAGPIQHEVIRHAQLDGNGCVRLDFVHPLQRYAPEFAAQQFRLGVAGKHPCVQQHQEVGHRQLELGTSRISRRHKLGCYIHALTLPPPAPHRTRLTNTCPPSRFSL